MAKGAALSRPAKFALMYGDAGGFMSKLSPKARAQVKALAAKRGLTVEGVLQPGPDALRSKSAAGLKAQAQATVGASYKPAEKQMSDREVQIHALDTKRQLDNQFYRDWLSGQTAKADAVSQASDAQLTSIVNNAHNQIDARYAQAGADLQHQDAATPGTVSDPAQSTANERLALGHSLAGDAADIAQAAAVGQLSRSGTDREALKSADFALAASLESKRMGDTSSSLAQLNSDRHSEQLQKAADVVKETSRLLGNEATKAQANEQYAALADKLGVQKQELTLKALTENHNYQIKKSNVRTDRQKLKQSANEFDQSLSVKQQQQATRDKQYQLDVKKLGQAQAKDNYLRKHKLGSYAPKGSTPDANQQKNTRAGVGGILQSNAISNQPGYKNNYTKYKNHLLAKGVNIAIINAGWQYSRGGVVGQTVKNLRGQGVVVPPEWRAGS